MCVMSISFTRWKNYRKCSWICFPFIWISNVNKINGKKKNKQHSSASDHFASFRCLHFTLHAFIFDRNGAGSIEKLLINDRCHLISMMEPNQEEENQSVVNTKCHLLAPTNFWCELWVPDVGGPAVVVDYHRKPVCIFDTNRFCKPTKQAIDQHRRSSTLQQPLHTDAQPAHAQSSAHQHTHTHTSNP